MQLGQDDTTEGPLAHLLTTRAGGARQATSFDLPSPSTVFRVCRRSLHVWPPTSPCRVTSKVVQPTKPTIYKQAAVLRDGPGTAAWQQSQPVAATAAMQVRSYSSLRKGACRAQQLHLCSWLPCQGSGAARLPPFPARAGAPTPPWLLGASAGFWGCYGLIT